MERVRNYVAGLVTSNNVHPRLIANFDQVWSMKFRPAKKIWSKKSELKTSQAPSGSAAACAALRSKSSKDLDVEATPQKRDPLAASKLQHVCFVCRFSTCFQQSKTLTFHWICSVPLR